MLDQQRRSFTPVRALGHLLDVFLLVLLRHRDVMASRLQVHNHHLAEPLFSDAEGVVDDVRDVILPARLKSLRQRLDLTMQ
jgi:hypothetical protein